VQALQEDRYNLSSRLQVLAFEAADPRALPAWAAGVRSVPTFIIFRDGQEVDRLVATGRDDIVAGLSEWVKANA